MQYDVPVGHDLFGRTVRCDVCGEGKQADFLLGLCGLSQEAQGWTFQNTKRTPANVQVYDMAETLAAAPHAFITLLSPGVYGVGKTRLLACLVNAARAAGDLAVYSTTADVLDYLRGAYNPDTPLRYDGRFDLLRSCKMLCLDEFDRWNPTPWAQEKFFQLVNARYESRAELLTAFAANANVADLPGYIASRMMDWTNYLFVMSGQDVRRLRREA